MKRIREEVVIVKAKYISMRVVAAMAVAAALGGPAWADSVSVGTTGPDSLQQVTITQQANDTVTNTNNVTVTNVNTQVARSGAVEVSRNTVVAGPVRSGDATNNVSQVTAVSIINGPEAAETPGQPGQPGECNACVNEGGQGGEAAENPAPNMEKPGKVLGAQVGGMGGGAGAMLPQTGPAQPMDVSGLRALWQPPVTSPNNSPIVKQTRSLTSAWLMLAALLSLGGAAGSALYERRRARKVLV